MIYTVTLSASADYTVRLDTCLEVGGLNRSAGNTLRAGGKGINAAIILARLGHDVASLGFVGGRTGDIITEALRDEGVENRMDILSDGETRINVKIRDTKITEVNGLSPHVDKCAASSLISRVSRLSAQDTVIVSGSVPGELQGEYYETLLKTAADSGAMLICDTSGMALARSLDFSPFLIKPNRAELEELVGEELSDENEIALAAEKICRQGVANVLVSLGPRGALLASGGRILTVPAVPVSVVNTVGSGDSMVAGFVSGFLASDDITRALRLGCAAGSATAGCDWLAQRNEIEELYTVTEGTVNELSPHRK